MGDQLKDLDGAGAKTNWLHNYNAEVADLNREMTVMGGVMGQTYTQL
jgi:hypothetical protein